MWGFIFFALFAVTALSFLFVHRRQRQSIRVLQRALAKIETEEERVFDFLHGLGEALPDTSRPTDLYVLIVEGVLRLLESSGGALYLTDRVSDHLRPAFVSRNCPPFFSVPESTQMQPGFTWQSYLRLHPVSAQEGVLGEAWKTREPAMLTGDDPRAEPFRSSPLQAHSALICPLIYGGENLGVLAVARGGASAPFILSEFNIFKSIAEQSAFALYNAILFSQAAEKKRLDQDLQVAHEIQRILLPNRAPEIAGFEISGLNIPAQQVSGDYFDYVPVDADHTGVVIADVSGKGVPASLIMAMCRSVLRSQATAQPSPALALHGVNAQLYPDIKEDMFISLAYVVLARNSSTLTLCRAGHDAPLLFRASDQSVTKINPPGMAMGIDSGGVFNRVTGDFSLSLEPGDCLVLYTDGITEALDSRGDEFGMVQVIKSIQASASEGAAAIVTRLTDDLRAFVGSHPQHDDITLIVIRKT